MNDEISNQGNTGSAVGWACYHAMRYLFEIQKPPEFIYQHARKIMNRRIYEGLILLNEQDPYEPTGVALWNGQVSVDLSDLLRDHFKCIATDHCSDDDSKTFETQGKRLRITVEEIEE